MIIIRWIRQLVVISFVLSCPLSLSTYPQQNTNIASQRTSAKFDTQDGNRQCQKPPFGKSFARTELFFGLSKLDGSEVSDEAFQDFVNAQVTPRFPDGFTLLAGTGQFKNSDGTIIREPSRLLILLYPSDKKSIEKIEEIRQIYKSQFQQQSVLRVDEDLCVSF